MEVGCLGLGTMDKAIAINSLHHGFKVTPLNKAIFRVKYTSPNRRNLLHTNLYTAHRHTCSCFMNLGALQETVQPTRSMLLPLEIHNLLTGSPTEWSQSTMLLLDLDPSTAKLAIGFIGPFLSVFGFLFILRIVMSWYPKLPVNKFPYVLAYAPTEPILIPTRKLIPPLGGVDVTPVVWFGLISFLNEILVGPQGLLVLLSQQAN